MRSLSWNHEIPAILTSCFECRHLIVRLVIGYWGITKKSGHW